MKNRRLLIILVVFICIVTFAVLGGVLFAVRTVDVSFANKFDFFDEEQRPRLEQDLRESILPFTMRQNSIFSINRQKITAAIENTNKRVRVTNIEVKSINKLVITVRERYPVFVMQYVDGTNTKTAVVCGQLRILETFSGAIDGEAYKKFDSEKLNWPLITMPDEIKAQVRPEDIKVGEFLTNLEMEESYIEILQQLAPFYFRLQSYEDALCNIFESISFAGTPGNLSLVMKSRKPVTDGPEESQTIHSNYFHFIIWNADSSTHLLTDKLTKGNQALEANHHYPGVYQVWEQAEYTVIDKSGAKTVLSVPNGILVTYREFYKGEREGI